MMERCTDKDDGKGNGCIKSAGHGSRCLVRPLLADWKDHQAGPAVMDTPSDVQPTDYQAKLAETLRVFAANLGIKATAFDGGALYTGADGRMILVTPLAALRPVALKLSEALTI
jgi:hypothetical protein